MKRTSTWTIVVLALSLIIIALVGWIAYLAIRQAAAPRVTINSFDSCIAAGNPSMETFPRQCRDPETGKLYVERVDNTPTDEPSTRTFTSTNGVTIEIDGWTDNKLLTSPVTLTGRVPGSWSFEASFPVLVKDASGTTLIQAPATLQDDWMTDELVSFTVTLDFTQPINSTNGSLVIEKSNPSDLDQNDDSLTLPVRFK